MHPVSVGVPLSLSPEPGRHAGGTVPPPPGDPVERGHQTLGVVGQVAAVAEQHDLLAVGGAASLAVGVEVVERFRAGAGGHLLLDLGRRADHDAVLAKNFSREGLSKIG